MRLLQENVEIKFSHTLAAGVNQSEITLPTVGDRQAFVAKSISHALDATATGWSVTGAGTYALSWAMAGKAQASPSDLLSLEKFLAGYVNGGVASGAVASMSVSPFQPAGTSPSPHVFRELVIFGHTWNITNPGNAVFRFLLLADLYQLTTSEYVDLID